MLTLLFSVILLLKEYCQYESPTLGAESYAKAYQIYQEEIYTHTDGKYYVNYENLFFLFNVFLLGEPDCYPLMFENIICYNKSGRCNKHRPTTIAVINVKPCILKISNSSAGSVCGFSQWFYSIYILSQRPLAAELQ